MFVVISGTNRPGNLTSHVARLVEKRLMELGREVHYIDLCEMPPSLYAPESYAEKPPELAPHQEAILAMKGIITVIPEYNGGFPGALKYFVDMLKFPESLVGKPAAFVGLSAGEWGALRGVEQMELVYQYRKVHLYGARLFINKIYEVLDQETGQLKDPALNERLNALIAGFVEFAERLSGS